MVFLLFDIEVAFLYPWAMAMRDLGWAGYIQIVLFTLILAAGYVTSGARACSTGALARAATRRRRGAQEFAWVSNRA